MRPLDAKNLTRRYLTWLYKTTKEDFDKVERKFTQTEVDKAILAELEKAGLKGKMGHLIEDWRQYAARKEREGLDLKFEGTSVRPEHRFNEIKLQAIEKVILDTLGEKALAGIKELYEREMTERIMKNTDHDR